MITRGLLVLSMLALPVIAEAQRGGGGGSGAPPIKGVSKSPRGDRANYSGLASGSEIGRAHV